MGFGLIGVNLTWENQGGLSCLQSIFFLMDTQLQSTGKNTNEFKAAVQMGLKTDIGIGVKYYIFLLLGMVSFEKKQNHHSKGILNFWLLLYGFFLAMSM